MQVGINQQIPPVLEFEVFSQEDRDATIAKGEFVGRDIDLVHVMPAGSKDKYPYVYSEWIANMKQEAKFDRFPKAWIPMIEAQYKAFKDGTPKPSFGTPLASWIHADPNTLKACRAARITTIEELASANEDTIRMLGMGARLLKRKAEKFTAEEIIPSNEELMKEMQEAEKAVVKGK